MIAGAGLNDVELVSTQTNNVLCNPLDLDYTVNSHSSVVTSTGILTCGGDAGSSLSKCPLGRCPLSSDRTSKCVLQSKEGQTTTFPSMKVIRYRFGLGVVNDMVYAVGGYGGINNGISIYQYGTTMEKINFKTDSEWTLTNLPFGVSEHCLATTTKSLVITGGYHDWVS